MIELRPFNQLGAADHGWLKAKHHFSFGNHYDPGNMGHGALRVWNDDEIAPNTGFPAHPHANMEIITYVREGAITHQDSLGNKGRTEAGGHALFQVGHRPVAGFLRVEEKGHRQHRPLTQIGEDDRRQLLFAQGDATGFEHLGSDAALGRDDFPVDAGL